MKRLIQLITISLLLMPMRAVTTVQTPASPHIDRRVTGAYGVAPAGSQPGESGARGRCLAAAWPAQRDADGPDAGEFRR